MGHLVNPISYRLGISKCWNSSWHQNISFAANYSFLIKSDYDIFLFFRRFFDLKLLVQSGYIFSHVKIIRERYKTFCVVYFYDGGSLERSDNVRHIFLSYEFQLFLLTNIFFLSLSSFLRFYNWHSAGFRIMRDFKFVFLFEFFKQKKRFFLLKKKLRISFYLQNLHLILQNLKISFLKTFDYSLFCNFDFLFKINIGRFIHKNFFLEFFFYCGLKFFFYFFFLKKKLMYSTRNFNTIFFKFFFKFFTLLRWKLYKRSCYLTKMINVCFNYFSYSRYFLYYFSDVLFFSTRIHSRLYHTVQHTFNKLCKTQNFSKWKIVLKKLEVTELSAAIVSKYLAVRLRQRFQLREVLMPILRHLTSTYFIRGFRIVCAGRFTRKEIALYDLRTYSSVPFSGVSSRLDYSLSEVVLKYSICGIKVWLHRHIVSENFFSIHGIGMNFIQMPTLPLNFRESLHLQVAKISKPYHSYSLMDLALVKKLFILKFKNKKMKLLRSRSSKISLRNLFAKFSFKMSPVVDFFYRKLSLLRFRNKRIKNKIFYKNFTKKSRVR